MVESLVRDVAVVEPDAVLRPQRLAEYVGQTHLTHPLAQYIAAAKQRGEPLDHVLLFGPPGLGKTTLAQIIANEMESTIRITSGPALERPGDAAALLTSLAEGDVLFIDEIHRLTPVVEEVFYSAMEDRRVDIVIGEGEGRRTVSIPLAGFTLVGATTRAGSLSAPLRDRFGIVGRLELYSSADLVKILSRSAMVLGFSLVDAAAANLAERVRGTPRIGNRILRRVRDVTQLKGETTITVEHVEEALDMLQIDPVGLDALDYKIMDTMRRHYGGGPVGLDTLATATGESAITLEDVVEPYLIQKGFIQRTPRGRMLTPQGIDYAHRFLALAVDKQY